MSTFETLYLTRSTSRMNEAVSSAVSSYLSARGNPPGPGDGVTIARTITNELDSARFDPLLVRTVARNASRVLDGLLAKVDGMVSHTYSSYADSWLIRTLARSRLHGDVVDRTKRDARSGGQQPACGMLVSLLVQPPVRPDRVSEQSVGDSRAVNHRE